MYMYKCVYSYHIHVYIHMYCMRSAHSAEATGGSVGQRPGALMICKGCLGSLGVHGGPWGCP